MNTATLPKQVTEISDQDIAEIYEPDEVQFVAEDMYTGALNRELRSVGMSIRDFI